MSKMEEASSERVYDELSDIFEFLEGFPTPEETLSLRPSDTLQSQIDILLEKRRTVGLTPTEEKLWQKYEHTEHLVRIAKVKAYIKLKNA